MDEPAEVTPELEAAERRYGIPFRTLSGWTPEDEESHRRRMRADGKWRRDR